MHVVEDLPEDATIEEAIERLLFLAKVERGLAQADAGETIAHEEVKERIQKWLR
jgi:predicted transcriptional regulator